MLFSCHKKALHFFMFFNFKTNFFKMVNILQCTVFSQSKGMLSTLTITDLVFVL